MKINSIFISKASIFFVSAFLLVGCQNMDEPALGDYPLDEANIPEGDLRFFVPFDKEEDLIRYQFAEELSGYPCFTPDNSISQGEGINGYGYQSGGAEVFLRYLNANDFASRAGSFTVAYWAKNDDSDVTEFTFSMTSDNWAKASMFALFEGTAAAPTIKFFVDEQPGDKWFEWVTDSSLNMIYDNEWHHMAFVYDGSTSGMTLYVDGDAKSTKTWDNHGPVTFNVTKIDGFRIGGSGNPSEGWMKSWSGGLDQFRLYAVALTPSQVQDLYINNN
ncbi:LamG domain-containing protein [Flavobacterium sp. U410]